MIETATTAYKAAASTILFAAMIIGSPALHGEEVVVTVTNLAPLEGVFLTPMWVGFHDGGYDSHDLGAAASMGFERLAEDGSTAALSNEFAQAQPFGVQATLASGGGAITGGATVQRTFELDPEAHPYFSYAAMVIPSNDAFVANDEPLTHRVFDPDGRFTPVTFLIVGNQVKDAGTEVNDELPQNTAALGQTVDNTGVEEAGVVTMHPGFLDDGRVLDARPDGDFRKPGYILARVTLRRARNTTITFSGNGAQEIPPVSTEATLVCSAKLYSASQRLQVRCEHDVAQAAAAHVHLGVLGSNGPVILPFADPANPLHETFDVDETLVEQLFAGELYVNVHSVGFPGGEVRAQIDGCFAGPAGLCLQERRFAVSATYTTADSSGDANAIPATSEAGQFTFFSDANVELDVKVLDGCAITGHFWVFAAGLTDVGVQLLVRDTHTGEEKSYVSPLGTAFAPITDTLAFPCS